MHLPNSLAPYATNHFCSLLPQLTDLDVLASLAQFILMASFAFFNYIHAYTLDFAAASCDIENSNTLDGFACQCSVGYKGAITWTGDTSSGTCSKTQCTGFGTTFDNGSVTKNNGDDHGSKASFQCNTAAGYVLVGPASITCDAPSADAEWPTRPTCGMLVDVALTVVTFHE